MCIRDRLVDDLRQVRVPGQQHTIAGQYVEPVQLQVVCYHCLLYTSDAADERSSVDLGGRRIIKKKTCANPCTRPDE